MSKYTKEQKYDFLMTQIYTGDIDGWECDGLLRMKLYYQFDPISDNPKDVDKMIENVLDEQT